MARHTRPRRTFKTDFAALLAEVERRGGMTVDEMAKFVGRDRRDLQGSIAGLRMRGALVASHKVGIRTVYVRGDGVALERTAPTHSGGGDRPTAVDDAQVRAVFALFARWGHKSVAGAA